MKNKKFIKMMEDELIPDNKDKIKERLGILETKKQHNYSFVKPVLAFAMVFALAFGLFQFFKVKPKPTPLTIVGSTYVSIDVNPSIEFILDENLNVTTCTPKNEKAKTLLVNENYVGRNIDDVTTSLVKRLNETGFISITNKKNAILVTTINEDDKSQKAIQEKIDNNITNYFETNHIFGVVIDGDNITNDTIKNEADSLSISLGKMKLIDTIYNSYSSTDPNRKTKEELSKMKMSELHDLLEDIDDKRDEVMDDLEEDLEDLIEYLEDIKEILEEDEEEKEEDKELPHKEEEDNDDSDLDEDDDDDEDEEETNTATLSNNVDKNKEKIENLKNKIEKQINKINVKYSPEILKSIVIDYKDIELCIKQIELIKDTFDELDHAILDKVDENHLTFKTDEFNTLITNELNKLKNIDKQALEEDYDDYFEDWLSQNKSKYENDWYAQKQEWEKEFD